MWFWYFCYDIEELWVDAWIQQQVVDSSHAHPDDDAFDSGGDKYLLAKTYFDCREYRRAEHVLQNQVGRKAVFLRCYAFCMSACLDDWWSRAVEKIPRDLQSGEGDC
eukprot:XP_023158075.1 uncharacterized protein LOC109946047 [Zea mays]